jgi:DNA repair exonuclease SbcCD ATPase subunit
MKYKDQAIWFLNGFWGDGVDNGIACNIWDYVKKFVELDLLGSERKGESGNELDQFWSAKYLEDMDTAMPAIARKEALKAIDQDNNGKMSCIEYLVWKYKKTVNETVDAPQGDNTEAIKKAQQKLDAVISQLAECEKKLQAQKTANAELHKLESELNAAIAELKKQEDDYQNTLKTLEKKSNEGSQVQRSKAANELAQLKEQDPLPLRKAKLTQEAALRKVTKQKQVVENAIAELEAAYVSLEGKMAEAQAELEKIKSKPGGGKGAIWWIQRELFEADSRLPRAKQKWDHSKPFSFNP